MLISAPSNIVMILAVAVGLIVFTFLLYLSRRSRKKIRRKREQIIHEWKERL